MIYTFEDLKKKIIPIAKKYRIPSVYLFGSYARQEATDSSDVDILIDREGSIIRGMFDMGGFYEELQENLNKRIDVVTIQTLCQKNTIERAPWFVNNLKKDMVIIYEQ